MNRRSALHAWVTRTLALETLIWGTVAWVLISPELPAEAAEPVETRLRCATYNVSLSRRQAGGLIEELADPNHRQARQAAQIIQRVRPDVLLLNEFDYDRDGQAIDLFLSNFLGRGQAGFEPVHYPHRYLAAVNTGVPSGLDLDGDGKLSGPADAYGFGYHPGQYGMVLLSRFPIREEQVRTFQLFLWQDLPGARRPFDPETGNPFYSAAVWSRLRLSSKSHWDIPIDVRGEEIHILVCHPTPPVFDGPEDRNGCRNHDEIRLWADYIVPGKASYLIDDRGNRGGLAADAKFVIAGDLNADPERGDSVRGAINQLLKHPQIDSSKVPQAAGETADRAATADFGRRTGMMRVDYVLPSRTLPAVSGGVFWPGQDEPGGQAVEASDHRLVWVDVTLP